MNLKQTDKLLKLLRSHNVSHFKSLEIEVRLEALSGANHLAVVNPLEEESQQAAVRVPPTPAAAPPVESTIPHHVNEVAAMLKLSDNDLVEKMFPEFPPQENEGS